MNSIKIHSEHTLVTKSGLVVLVASMVQKPDVSDVTLNDLDESHSVFEKQNPDQSNDNSRSSHYDERERFIGFFKPNANVLVVFFLCSNQDQ